MGTKKPRHSKEQSVSTRISLTKEVASALAEKIKNGESLFTDEQYKTNTAIDLPLKDGVFVLKPMTYNAWMKRRIVIPETNKTLYSVMMEARHDARMKKHEDEQKNLVIEAQNLVSSLQKLPLGTLTRRKLKKMRVIEGGRKIQTHEELETIETPIDPRVVAIKQKGAEYVLDRLDPAYAKNAEKGNVNVFVNLADLRKAKEERQPTPVPAEDVKIIDHDADKQVQQEATTE